MAKRTWKNYKRQLEKSKPQNEEPHTLHSTFSGVVTGNTLAQDSYKESWPELATTVRAGCSRTSQPSSSEDGPARKMTRSERFLMQVEGKVDEKTAGNSLNITASGSVFDFPPLSSSIMKLSNRSRKIPSFTPSNNNTESVNVFQSPTTKKGSRPKRNSIIVIDLKTAIQVSLQRKMKAPKRLSKRPEKVLVGNPLDSSNPIRKKGKVRPHKKKTLTALKKLILKERALLKKKSDKKLLNVGKVEPTISVSNNLIQTENPDFPNPNVEAGIQEPMHVEHLNISKVPPETKSELQQPNDVNRLIKDKIHSKKFPVYCDNTHSKELDWAVGELVQTLRRFQDRAYAESAVKATARRRYVLGIHECQRRIAANDIRLLIVPFNIEEATSLWLAIENLKMEAAKQEIPVVFASRCQTLSKCLFKKNRTCAVGIINYDGAHEVYNKVMTLWDAEKKKYESLLISAKEELGLLEIKKEKRPSLEECLAMSIIEKLKIEETVEEEKVEISG